MEINFKNRGVGFVLPSSRSIDRDKFIVNYCTQKNVIHLGCVDYPLLEQRIKEGQLLHLKILKVAKKVWGIDIDAEGIKFLKEKFNIPDLIVANAEQLPSLKSKFQDAEVAVAGEIFEHVNNVGMVVNGLYEVLPCGGTLIATVPNALAIRIFFHNFKRRENVHPDHVYYFSPYTMASMLKRYKFKVEAIYGYWYPSTRSLVKPIKNFIFSILSKYNPFIGDGIVVVAKKE